MTDLDAIRADLERIRYSTEPQRFRLLKYVENLADELEAKRAKLKEYGQHTAHCADGMRHFHEPCTCGFDEACK